MKLKLVTILLAVCVVVDCMIVGSLNTRTDGGIELTKDVGRSASEESERAARGEEGGSGRWKRSGERVEERAIERQVNQLKKMKCKPQLQKIHVASELEETHEVKFNVLLPQVVPVKRCTPSCSYCGDGLGLERSRCVSIKHKMEVFTISYFDALGKRQYFTLPIRVDVKCQCQ